MQILKENNKRTRLMLLKSAPASIKCEQEKKATLCINDKEIESACLKCYNPRCMFLEERKIQCSRINDFPEEKDNRACPVDALSWDNNKEMPVIDEEKCIKCGICASQCTVGAIYFKDYKFVINDTYDSKYYIEMTLGSEEIEKQESLLRHIEQLKKQGEILKESDKIIEMIYHGIVNGRIVPEKLVRNILVSLKCECAIRRIGDVYTRMDAVYVTKTGTFGATEVEFGTDTLEALRAVLDDIAVLQSRYEIDKQDNTALVVCLSLPNIRQGYWQVVKDIANVIDIKINTHTIGSLLVLLWNFMDLDLKINPYYADYDSPEIRHSLESHLGRKVEISNKLLGVLEPIK